ncbi:MAG: asparagine synthetase A [Thaumarchaeota archaeon]|jgi:asparaginyl-tRNA synthetase|nr:asparagine synthetase A [Candidatus Geocrenenecus arthurdayi]MCL7391769.1 asparagine synthetase A [Candidatus Geocrenenecus arthurdayi]MCL7397179.1 asparagine synthetase A [Candidatus Geocrenenecus arthurdayi]
MRIGDSKMPVVLKIQSKVLKTMTDILLGKGFQWILPVILAKSTDPLWPDPGYSIEDRIEVEVYGTRVKTMQSMIVHKRVLVSLGPEKIFILSPNIRIESRKRMITGKHLYEFTQLDLEVAYAKMKDIFTLFEELIVKSIEVIKKEMHEELELLSRDLRIPTAPFRVYKRAELEKEYGDSWEEEISRTSRDPVWVTDIPRQFYDFQDFETGEWRNYDLILPEGYGEVLSGAEREYEYEKILKKIERDGLRKDDYRLILDLAEKKLLKPSAGAGIGVERFIQYICGLKHIGEVQPFPRIPGIVPDL